MQTLFISVTETAEAIIMIQNNGLHSKLSYLIFISVPLCNRYLNLSIVMSNDYTFANVLLHKNLLPIKKGKKFIASSEWTNISAYLINDPIHYIVLSEKWTLNNEQALII